ncbi:kinase related to hydroxyacetone kinase [Nocardia farcinica]|nr:kinase related to hydroxyacetone kinase [Nocardia farcinica]
MTVPGERETIDSAALMLWGRLCLEGLAERREEINSLNVFPIPDADTGTNLLATMRAAVAAAEDRVGASHGTAHEVATAMARGATAGARGNSGIILSQLLRGIAEASEPGPLTAATLPRALRRAAELVRAALSAPVEGTILTVLECAADSASACREPSLAEVAVAAADGAAKALGDTPSQLPVLRANGVVDAGARGLVVLLDALVAVTRGHRPARPEYRRPAAVPGARPAAPGHAVARTPAASASASEGPPTPGFEVMYLVSDSDDARIERLRGALTVLGDSVVVVGDGAGTWSVHVHCADAGAAVEAGLAAGTPRGIRIESFDIDGVGPDGGHADDEPEDGPADRGVLAVATGADAAALFEAAGAVVLDDHPVTSAGLLSAIRQMPHREVLVLPNGALPAHELVAVGVAARGEHRDVLLLPSGSMVQGLAALAVHDRARIAVDDAFAMSEAAAATRWGSLRRAEHRALTMVGTCAPGDGLGLVGHDVVVIDRDVPGAGRTLLDRMLGLGGELVTLLLGADADPGLAEELCAHIEAGFPGVEVVVYPGGQRGDLVQIGVE